MNVVEILMKIHNYLTEFNKPPEDPLSSEDIGLRACKTIVGELHKYLGENQLL